MQQGKTDIDVSHWDKVGKILKMRVPNLGDAVEGLTQTSKPYMRDMVLRKLKDKILEGWDNQQLAMEIGKEILGNPKNIRSDVLETIGAEIWKRAFG